MTDFKLDHPDGVVLALDQMSVYLRLLDVPVPSIYGPSADENPFAEARTAAAVSA